MAVTFPPEFRSAWKQAGVKKVYVSDWEDTGKGCQNCGGHGFLTCFVATMGPFNNPANDTRIVTTFRDGKWWGGATISAKCPVCKGNA